MPITEKETNMSDTKQAFAEIRLNFDSGDAWGSTMAWLFAVADALTDKAPDLVPPQWQFRQSPFGSDKSQYEYEIAAEWNTATLIRLGNALSRYAARLKAAGLDY
jgi:hypothetical protein